MTTAETTVSLANRNHASTRGPDGREIDFEAGVPQPIEAGFAHQLLANKDAGFYEPGHEKLPQIDPSLVEAEMRGRIKQSPFEPYPEAEKDQAVLDAAEVDRQIAGGADIPPQYGRGSSAAQWMDYAHSLGHEPPEQASRDQIIRYLEARGVPTIQEGETATIGGLDHEDEEPEDVKAEVSPEVVDTEVAPPPAAPAAPAAPTPPGAAL